MIGDTVFALGAISFVYFALNLMWQRHEKKVATVPAEAEVVQVLRWIPRSKEDTQQQSRSQLATTQLVFIVPGSSSGDLELRAWDRRLTSVA